MMPTSPPWLPGIQLAELFYRQAVAPIVARAFPALRYSAALLGSGSEVLGFDTPMSADHNWGPRLLLFLTENTIGAYDRLLDEALSVQLPAEFAGYSTHFVPAPGEERTFLRATSGAGPVHHRIEITTVRRFVNQLTDIKTYPRINLLDWLVTPQQRLLELTAGAIFHDGIGELVPMREAFRWYPHDIWLYLLSGAWKRMAQLEAFVGRCGHVGDEVGSTLIAASLTRDLMRLVFLMERRYAPYPKWFGTAFATLPSAGAMAPLLHEIMAAKEWRQRERALVGAYQLAARIHNGLNLTEPISEDVRPFHNRPFLVLGAERFARAIAARIEADAVRELPDDIGGIDQWVDSTDVLSDPARFSRLKALYQRGD
jgi:hypothetical protein